MALFFFSVSLVLRGGCDTDMEQEQSKDVKREEGMHIKRGMKNSCKPIAFHLTLMLHLQLPSCLPLPCLLLVQWDFGALYSPFQIREL